jgi:hypothetical protein
MPAGAEWAWVEAYGNGHLDPEASHGTDWDAAVADAGERLEQLLPHEELEAMLPAAITNADVPPSKMLLHGSGWGVVERSRRLRTAGDGSMKVGHRSWMRASPRNRSRG